MRNLASLSYSGYTLWRRSPEEFYLRYLAETRAPKLPQEKPMAVGSAFDAACKSSLHAALFGSGVDLNYGFDALFEQQVEPHNRVWARQAGLDLLAAYKLSGAYDDLLELLRSSSTPPRFEFKVERVIEGIPLTGRPDCRFSFNDLPIILDWKVKGYFSGASPSKFYLLCRDGWLGAASRSHNKQHPLCVPVQFRGLRIHVGQLEPEYMAQLSIYSWLEGLPVGAELAVLAIDELACKSTPGGRKVRVATHRCQADSRFQAELLEDIRICWERVSIGNIFDEDNKERCAALERQAERLNLPSDEFSVTTRKVPVY
jgi:hypothetical protein